MFYYFFIIITNLFPITGEIIFKFLPTYALNKIFIELYFSVNFIINFFCIKE